MALEQPQHHDTIFFALPNAVVCHKSQSFPTPGCSFPDPVFCFPDPHRLGEAFVWVLTRFSS